MELKVGEKPCSLISLYRSPSETQEEFVIFAGNLYFNLDLAVHNNPYLVAVLGDFNVKSKNWYECDKTSFDGNVINPFFPVWENPSHISDIYSSCIHVIFTS